MKTKRSAGRPAKGTGVNWASVSLRWGNWTDKKIATHLGVAVSTVFRRRQKMLAEGKKVACKREKYSRV